jgi:GMP synthase-like glutamine amidotransferase
MHIHCLLHVPFETPGTILNWIVVNGHSISYTHFYEPEHSLPETTTFDALLIMGGSMNVDEEQAFSWLKAEKAFIRKSLSDGKKVLGICLGAQLIAAASGAKVYKGKEKEIGFFPLQFSADALAHPFFDHFKQTYTLFHWHGDTFDLPPGAVLLASTTVCPHQAFMIDDHVLALQFHPEMNEHTIGQMILHDGHELEEEGNYIQSAERIKDGFTVLDQNKKDLFLLLDKFLAGS